MTLRYDPNGRPAGLDWSALADHCPQDPSVWAKAPTVKTKRPGTTDEIETEIVRLHLAGASSDEIAQATDVSTPTVAAVLTRRLRGTRQQTPDDVADEIVRLYTEESLSGAVIGVRTGVRHATVYRILRRRGITPRSQGGKSRVAA
jgi:transposase